MIAKKRTARSIRQSITVPASIAKYVRKVADAKRLSVNQVLVDLVETGIQARDREKEQFMALAAELTATKSRRRQSEIKQELAKLTFGD